MARTMSENQLKFFNLLAVVEQQGFPNIARLWDFDNVELKVSEFENALGVMSSGEIQLAKFLAAVWFGNNSQYGFDLIVAMSKLDTKESEIIWQWVNRPFLP